MLYTGGVPPRIGGGVGVGDIYLGSTNLLCNGQKNRTVYHYSAEIFSIAVIMNFVSLPLISRVKSSSIFFPTMAWPKGEW